MFKFQNQQTEQNMRRRQVVEEAQGPPQTQYVSESLLRGSERFRRAPVALMQQSSKKQQAHCVEAKNTHASFSKPCCHFLGG